MMIIFFWFCLFSDPLKQKRPLSAFFFNLKNEMMFFCFFFFWEKKQKSQLVIGVYNKEGGRDHHLFRVECVIRSNSFIFLWPPPQLSPQCQVKKVDSFWRCEEKRNWTFFLPPFRFFFVELFGNDSWSIVVRVRVRLTDSNLLRFPVNTRERGRERVSVPC
jgi:hypothetical protein